MIQHEHVYRTYIITSIEDPRNEIMKKEKKMKFM